MKYNDKQMEIIFNKYIEFVDGLDMNYSAVIKNLLYIIIPGFVLRYGIENEKIILNVFRETTIKINDTKNSIVQAYYQNLPYKIGNTIKTKKSIVLLNYRENNLVELLDNLVHEYNHAVNSYSNGIIINDDSFKIRTGISYIKYDKESLKFISKDKSYIFEEILNTKETEEIINIIHGFKKYNFENSKINSALYLIDNHITDRYSSDAYLLETIFTSELIKNTTFLANLSSLRIKGNVEDINYWFDNITGKDGSFNRLIDIVIELSSLKYDKNLSFFKKRKLNNKVKELYKNTKEIINLFNNNCNFM